jgi:hypothetical protein
MWKELEKLQAEDSAVVAPVYWTSEEAETEAERRVVCIESVGGNDCFHLRAFSSKVKLQRRALEEREK